MSRHIYEITDDSGFMALVDPAGYKSFVDDNWTFNQLVRHFKEAMKNQQLVIWGTGREDIWRVEVRFRSSSDTGFREFSTFLCASTGQLLLTNYESLTMAAQFDDVSLPQARQQHLLVSVTPGVFHCRIIQRFDPEHYDPTLRERGADFVIELNLVKNSDQKVGNEDMPVIPWTEF